MLDLQAVASILDCLSAILAAAFFYNELEAVSTVFEACGALGKLEELQTHESLEVSFLNSLFIIDKEAKQATMFVLEKHF
jgi:hypothetical protein